MKIQLLTILRDLKLHLIVDLCKQLGCSSVELSELRAAWVEGGVNIHECSGRYQLLPQLPPLDVFFLKSQLLPAHVWVNSIVDSTNQYLLDHLPDLQKGDLCLADYQWAGRGRRGRTWEGTYAGQILLSLYWEFKDFAQTEGLSLVIGLAVCQALCSIGCPGLKLKWPNDILLFGKKLGGILIETSPKTKKVLGVVIGLGLNLSLPIQLKANNPRWAELAQVEVTLDRNQLVLLLMRYLRVYLKHFERKGFEYFQKEWVKNDYFWGQTVQLVATTSELVAEGIEKGVDRDGAVLILTKENSIQAYRGGEISLLAS
ncbi:MAG: bifunctional biotin--[acetyl-CoA-carboxylase] ligase/biotin operon repressor BirA [Neisseriaceae bacterium]